MQLLPAGSLGLLLGWEQCYPKPFTVQSEGRIENKWEQILINGGHSQKMGNTLEYLLPFLTEHTLIYFPKEMVFMY